MRTSCTSSFVCLIIAPLIVHGELKGDGYHVSPGEEIQAAIDAAGTNKTIKKVIVHAGTYRPNSKRLALIWLNRRHDGVQLVADGDVTLTPQNPEVAGPGHTNTAVVNHVIYIGHLVGTNTLIRGFRITGANAFCLKTPSRRVEPDETVPKNLFFFTDGGGIKIFGQSAPILENLTIEDNWTSPCGAGISVQQQDLNRTPAVIRNCIFRNNRAQVTGAALDLLAGSSAIVENCLFVENASNLGHDVVAEISKEKPFTNSGVITVFQRSSLIMKHSTLTRNRNAVDDLGGLSILSHCIVYGNSLDAGLPGTRYELELSAGSRVENCQIDGLVRHLAIHRMTEETLRSDAPDFDENWAPRNSSYAGIGYRALKARPP